MQHTAAGQARVIVVIPALNEESSLPLVLQELPPVDAVIVVDNGSSDNTASVARAGGAEVLSEPRRGYGQACLSGIARAEALGADILVILDGDHSDYPAELPALLAPILSNEADMVLGERTERAEPHALNLHQRFGNRLTTRLIAWESGHRYRDMGPFRAIRMTKLAELQMSDTNYGWNVEMQMKAVHHGLRIREISVGYRPRIGASKISGSLRGSIRASVKIIWSVWKHRQ